MKQIPLTQGKFAIVDDADFEWLSQHKWYFLKARNGGYACRKIHLGNRKCRTVYMHAEIMGTPAGKHTDHINGERLDNRRENLRICSASENCSNGKISKNNSTGFKGVVFHAEKKKFMAQIHVQRKNKFLGYFTTAQEAHAAYCEAAKKHHGKFARFE
jgi:HNH endonuclease/AP2 domain